MVNKQQLIQSASAAFLILATQSAIAATTTAKYEKTTLPETEKCYGVVRAGMNDCATATSSCAGSATKDAQPDAFLFVPKGMCAKLVGGKLKSE